jgi:hypothetical protein
MAYHEVLTSAQRQRVTESLDTLSDNKIVRYFTLSAADLDFIHRYDSEENQIGVGVQVCFLRYPGRPFLETDRVPDTVLVYIARQIGIRSRALQKYAQPRKQTRNDHLKAIQSHFGFQVFDEAAQQAMTTWLLPLACETDDGLTLVTRLQEEMRKRQIIQPNLDALEEFVWQVRRKAQQSLYERLTTPLQPRHYQALAQLVSIRPGTTQTVLTWLQTPPGEATSKEFNQWADRLKFLRGIDLPVARLYQAIPHSRLVEFARAGAKLTPRRLNKPDISPDLLQQYYAWLVAFSLERISALTDQTLQMSDDLGGRLFRNGEGRRNKQFQHDGKAINSILRTHSLSGQTLIKAREAGTDPYAALEAALGWEKFLQSVQVASDLSRPRSLSENPERRDER